MAWMRLEVNYQKHPKFLVLTDGAFRLWHQGKAYCEEFLTDGLISEAAATNFPHYTAKRARELTTVVKGYDHPLWEPHDVGYKMHDFLLYNDSRDVAQARMAKKKADDDRRRKNQANYRDRQKQERDRHGDQHVTDNAVTTVT